MLTLDIWERMKDTDISAMLDRGRQLVDQDTREDMSWAVVAVTGRG